MDLILELKDWVFDVDIAMNMECSSSQAADHCLCGYCRNYYTAVDSAYPHLRPFLQQFGLNIEGPDELSPFEPTIYEATYLVNGMVLQKGTQPLYLDNTPLYIQSQDESDLETERKAPYFTVVFGLMELPWFLDEPMDQVTSPANEDAYLDRMWNKLLKRSNEEIYTQ